MTYKEKALEHKRARDLAEAMVKTLRAHKTSRCPLVQEDGNIWEGAPWTMQLLGSVANERKIRANPRDAHFLLRRISKEWQGSSPSETLALCYNALLTMCSKNSDGRLAHTVYGEMKGEGARVAAGGGNALKAANVAATAMAKGKMWRQAKETLDAVGEMDNYGRVVAMRVARGVGDVEEGRKTLEGWEDERSKFLGWSILVDILKEKEGEWKEVEGILSSALELTSKLGDGKNGTGYKPNDLAMSYAGVYSPSILAAAKLGEWEFIRGTIDDIEREQYRLASVYAHAIKGVKEGVQGGAFTVEEGTDMVGRVFARVLQLYDEGVMDKRRRFEMQTAFYWVATFAADLVCEGGSNDVELGLGREGKVEVTKWLLGWMEKLLENESVVKSGKRPTMSAYTQVIKTMGRAGEGEKAWEMFRYETEADKLEVERHAKSGFRGNNDGWVVTNTIGWNVVLKACLYDEGGPAWDRAKQIFEAMDSSIHNRDDFTWYHLLEVAAAAGEIEEAIRYLEYMIREERTHLKKRGPNKLHFRVVLEAIKGGINRLEEGDERFKSEDYTNMVVKVVSQGLRVLGKESYHDLVGSAMGPLSSLGREGDGVRVLMDRGLLEGGEVVGLNGCLDLHGCNVPLALGGVHWIAERAEKEGWTELVIVTGNERVDGEGIRNNVIKVLDEAGCEGFYSVDKNQNGKNKGRINIMGKVSIEKVAAGLKELR
ncbi:hypothetical protein TrRE_jg7352 [Triparma retinervis]|uniref:Uncharacterized protein n=1 Tax=Triparma retinervis TaxID=2557542 RepID=A0A9W7CHC3_9STRA|nr:hypothetical protein TrRE_jg7352 [Triparma retinervis]